MMAKSLQLGQHYSDEATLLRKVTEWVAPQQRDGIKLMRICDRYTKGYSDLFMCVNGMLVVAELKDDTGTASPQQLKFIEEIRTAGGIGNVCRTVQDVADLIEEAKRRTGRWTRMP